MATLLEEELGKEMKQRQNNHTDEEIEIFVRLLLFVKQSIRLLA